MSSTIYYVGTESEVGRHAAPLMASIEDLEIAPPEVVDQQAKPGDVAIFFSEHFDRFRDLCVALKERRVPSIYAIDGILEWRNAWEYRDDEVACPWTMRPCLSDVVASIGPSQTRILRSWGNTNIYTVGIPRLDNLCPQPDEPPKRSAVGVGQRFRILVVTARCPGFTAEQVRTTRASVQHLNWALEKLDELNERSVEIVWRLTGGLDDDLGIDSDNETDIATLIRRSDAVVSTASTVLLESMLLGKPTVLLDYHNTPCLVPTSWAIRCEEQILPTMEEIAALKEDHPKLQMQEYLLHEAVSTDGQATMRMQQLIQATALRAERCRQEETWNFHRVLDELSGQAQPIPRRNQRPEKPSPELEVMSPQQWSGYTEQLRRENRRLSRLVDEAHQVFDHMQGHPMLGPLLKTHKWFQQRVMKKPPTMIKPPVMEEDR